MPALNDTHDSALTSWVESANGADSDFPIQNLPFAEFRRKGSSDAFRGGVAIGDQTRVGRVVLHQNAGLALESAWIPSPLRSNPTGY